MKTFKEIQEALKIVKMALPNKSKTYNLKWNDSEKHSLFDRILLRTKLNRKEIIKKILSAIDKCHFDRRGPFIVELEKSQFYVVVFVEKPGKTLTIKSILGYDFKLRGSDEVLTVLETEELFSIDLKEFYEDGFVNGYYGSLLIEESVDRKVLEVHPDIIKIQE